SSGGLRRVRSAAGDAIVAALLDVEVEMVAMVVIVAGTQHGVEILASVRAHRVEEAALAEAEKSGFADVDLAAVVELYGHDVQRVALAVFGKHAPASGDLAA